MKESTEGFLAIVFLVAFCGAGMGGLVGWAAGKSSGWIDVASGQVICTLGTKADKTTEWNCRYYTPSAGEHK